MSQRDPLAILENAPSFSDISQDTRQEDDSYEETRICDHRATGSERLRRQKEFVNDFLNKRCRLLLVYGEIFLGKAYFAKEIIRDLQDHHFDTRLPVHCLGMTSFESLMTSLLSCLEQATSNRHRSVIAKLADLTSGSRKPRLILLFTNFEDIAAQDEILRRFSILLYDMLTACPDVSVIVTSRLKVNILHEDFSFSYKLDPPSEAECCRLLTPIRPFCKTYEPIFRIVRRCLYRPALILHVRHIILSNHIDLTPEQISKLLQPEEAIFDLLTRVPLPGGSVTEAIKRQLSRLPAELNADTRMLCSLDGTFGIVEATQVLQRKTVTNFKIMTLLPLKEHAILDIDMCTQQIRMDPLIRQFILNDIKHLRDNDPNNRFTVDYLVNMLRMTGYFSQN